MSVNTEELAAGLVHAYANSAETVEAGRFAGLSVAEAMEIQQLVLEALGETVPVVKVAIMPDGTATVAPIMASLVVADGGRLKIPTRGLVGVEIEIAARLRSDITPAIAAGGNDAILRAIETLICGIEVIGTRFDDRRQAGAFGPLADYSLTAGYAYGTIPWTGGTDVDRLDVELLADGKPFYTGKAKHPFGGVLKPIEAYGQKPNDRFGALRAGMIVTTGSLCGAVAIPHPGMITARLANTHEVRLELV